MGLTSIIPLPWRLAAYAALLAAALLTHMVLIANARHDQRDIDEAAIVTANADARAARQAKAAAIAARAGQQDIPVATTLQGLLASVEQVRRMMKSSPPTKAVFDPNCKASQADVDAFNAAR